MTTKTKNILVALDLSDLDEKLIQYASVLADELNTENVYFVHNIKKYRFSEVFHEKLKDVDLESIVQKKLDDKVNKLYKGKASYEVLISEDPSTENLISYITSKYGVGLVIVGNKNSNQGYGTVSGKLLRILKSDILMVPREAKLPFNNLICTTDFSKSSQKGVLLANDLAKAKNAELRCINVYKLPQAYFPYLSAEDATKSLEKHADKQFAKMTKQLNLLDLKLEKYRAGDSTIAERIRAVAEKENVDALFVSDKGHGSLVSLLVGSVTEDLFTNDLHVPLWVVK